MSFFDTRPADRRFLSWAILFTLVGASLNSIWCIYIDDVVNNDAVEYIRAAERFAVRDWAGAFAVHQWPFFSALMWVTGRVFGISYEAAGYLLNSVFFSAASVFFVLVVHAFGGTTRRLVSFAVLLAVLHPSFNEYRAYIIRDGGFLAFYLLGLFLLIRSTSHHRFTVFALAGLSFLIAGAFRIEGVIFVMSLPLLAWAAGKFKLRSSLARIVVGLMAALVIAIVAGWWFVGVSSGLHATSLFFEPYQLLASGWTSFTEGFEEKVLFLQAHYLPSYAAHFAGVIAVLTAGIILIALITSQVTVPWVACILWGRLGLNFRFLGHHHDRLWIVVIGIHVFILSAFVLTQFFVTPRYPLGLSMTVLAVVPFVLNGLNLEWDSLRMKRVRHVIAALLFLWAAGESLSGLDNVTRANALKSAGMWLADRATTAGSLVTNDRRVAYYAGRHNDSKYIQLDSRKMYFQLRKNRWPDATWIAIRLRRDDEAYLVDFFDGLSKRPVKIFDAGAGDRVFIFER